MQTWKVSFFVLSACVLCACPAPSGNDGGTGGGSGVTGGGSGTTGGGSAVTGGGTAVTGGGSAVTGGGSAVTGGGSAVTGGGTAVTGGGTGVTGGGTAVTGGGTGVTGGGTAVTGGGSGTIDAGIDCNTIILDPALGTLELLNGATVNASAALPDTYVVAGVVAGQMYGLSWGNELVPLGTFPTLSAGAPISILDPVDVIDGGSVFPSMFFVTHSTQALVGYTRSDVTGELVLFETTDGGLLRVDSNGNFAASLVGEAPLVNALSLGPINAGAALYSVGSSGPFVLATFPTGSASGYVTALSDGTIVAGYSDSTFTNHLHVASPALYGPALAGGTSFALATAPELSFGTDYVSYVVAAGPTLVLGRNGGGSYTPTRIETLPLDGGAPQTFIDSVNTCTTISFVQGASDGVWVGVVDRAGPRLLKVQP